MRHQHGLKKLGRDGAHRKALLRNMATSLFSHERIMTTHAKAMALRPFAEGLITLAKKGDLAARRLVARDIQNHDVVGKLFSDLASRYKERPGGYTRVLKLGLRKGDNALKAMIELVDRPIAVPADVEKKATEKKTDEKKTAEKKTVEAKPQEKKTAEKKTVEKKTAEKKPAEKKASEKKTAEKSASPKKTTEKKTTKKSSKTSVEP